MELQIDGRTAYAYTGGRPFDPALPCVVFLHGASHDHSVWSQLARWFAHHGHAVLAVDQPGHRRSQGPLLPSIEALADWTLALLDAAGVARAALAGHSMGSLIALACAQRAPSRVTRLVMLGTTLPMTVSPALRTLATDDPAAGMALVNSLCFSGLAIKPGVPGPGTWAQGANLRLMQAVQAGQPQANVFAHDFHLCHAYAGGLEAAAGVDCPSHLILADGDQMTPPRTSQALASALRADVHRVPGGHSLMQEQPEAVLAALRRALG